MKPKPIVNNEIKQWHPYNKPYQTDACYRGVANLLLKSFSYLEDEFDNNTNEIIRRSAIVLTHYLEDIVSDCGIWRAYSGLCREWYDLPVPLYHQNEEYFADEPSLNAVRHMIWCVVSDVTDQLVFADANVLDEMAHLAYEILEEVYEEIPINEQLAEDMAALLEKAATDFEALRYMLKWLYRDCYLIAGKKNEEMLSNQIEAILQAADEENHLDISDSTAFYLAFTSCIFKYKIGPLACYPKDYLAALMRTKGMEQEAAEVDGIEIIDMGAYKINHAPSEQLTATENRLPENWLTLTRTNGRQIEIKAEELNLPEGKWKEVEGITASSFVCYRGEWHLNGILMTLSDIEKTWKELCEKDPDYMQPGTATLTAQDMLKRTEGRQIAYFADRNEMKVFLEQKLQFPHHLLSIVDAHKGNLPVIFIDPEEAKHCLQFFYGFSPYIAAPDNPFYDKAEAQKHAIDFLWDAESVTTHAVNYLLDHDYLPDLYDDELLSRFSTREEKRHDIDFLMRFHRRKDY